MARLCCFVPKIMLHTDGTVSERFKKAPLCSHGDCWEEYFLRNPLRVAMNLKSITQHGADLILESHGYMHLDRIKERRGIRRSTEELDLAIVTTYGKKYLKHLMKWAAKTSFTIPTTEELHEAA